MTFLPVDPILKTFRIFEMIDQRNALTTFSKVYTSWTCLRLTLDFPDQKTYFNADRRVCIQALNQNTGL